MELLERQLKPHWRTTLQNFLQLLNELQDLVQREKTISGEIYAMEASIDFTKDDPPEKRIWYFEELIRLRAQMRDLDQEMLQKRNQCNAMRDNPPF